MPDQQPDQAEHDEQLELLGQELTELDEAYADRQLAEPEYRQRRSKLAFQISRLKGREAVKNQQTQDKDQRQSYERGRTWFND